MDLSDLKNIHSLLKKYEIRPNKRLGQNFLASSSIVKKVMGISGAQKEDIVLEIGPGMGVLTQDLAEKAKKVLAVEKDGKMCGVLLDVLLPFSNVKIINEDIFDFLPNFREKNYKVVANVPYYATAHIIRSLLERENQPQEIVLIIQKEVAERICAKPPKASILSISVQFYGTPKIVGNIKKTKFWPIPKVDSAILKISDIGRNKFNVDEKRFFQIVRAGFHFKRKTLANNLAKGLEKSKEEVVKILWEIGIDPKRRAETLSIEEWIVLAKMVFVQED